MVSQTYHPDYTNVIDISAKMSIMGHVHQFVHFPRTKSTQTHHGPQLTLCQDCSAPSCHGMMCTMPSTVIVHPAVPKAARHSHVAHAHRVVAKRKQY